jgi:primase-polymerase (primpol)-like protein
MTQTDTDCDARGSIGRELLCRDGSREEIASNPIVTLPALHELAQRQQWVAWQSETRSGRPTKVPFSPRAAGHANVTDPTDWVSYREARGFQRENGLPGVGYVFSRDDPYTGVDLDNCREPNTGTLKPWADHIVRQLDSYTEVSPSGTGVKIWVRARIPGDRHRTGHIEIYDHSRYFTVTGQHLPGTPTTIEDRQTQLDDLYCGLFGYIEPQSRTASRSDRPEPTPGSLTVKASVMGELDDEEVLRKAMAAKNGHRFSDLWHGQWQSYKSQSEADLALCRMLAYWTDGKVQQMDRLFRRSGLMRPKWDCGSQTYGERTLSRAIS